MSEPVHVNVVLCPRCGPITEVIRVQIVVEVKTRTDAKLLQLGSRKTDRLRRAPPGWTGYRYWLSQDPNPEAGLLRNLDTMRLEEAQREQLDLANALVRREVHYYCPECRQEIDPRESGFSDPLEEGPRPPDRIDLREAEENADLARYYRHGEEPSLMLTSLLVLEDL